MEKLNQSGFDAYLVGGCVRDYLLQQDAKDVDIATNASPAEVMLTLAGYRVIVTGLKHGTVTVVIDRVPLEITTYRSYGEPPSSLAADLSKRDFTINALAYHEQTGIVDLHQGMEDLQQKFLRCVGKPEDRFAEDGLRILRALRLASVLGFTIEENTRKAMFAQKDLLRHMAKERIAAELTRLLCGNNAQEILMEYVEILGVFMPDLLAMKDFQQNNPHHIYDVLTHTAVVIANVPPIPHLKLAALLHDIGKPPTYSQDENGVGHFYGHQELGSQMARKILLDLKFDTFTVDRVGTLVQYHDLPLEPNPKQIKRCLNKLSPEIFQELLVLKKADIQAQNPEFLSRLEILRATESLTQNILAQSSCFSLKDLNINGNDLMNLGVEPGKQVGSILNELLNAVIDEELANEFSALEQQAQRLIASNHNLAE